MLSMKAKYGLHRIFPEHPREAGEKYGEHLLFTLRIAGYLQAKLFRARVLRLAAH